MDSQGDTMRHIEADYYGDHNRMSYMTASQTLWSTGMLAEKIPNGFYSVIPEKGLKDLFDDIPTLDQLYDLEFEGFKADIILVDAEKDKKLFMLKQLIVALVKGLRSNPAAMIKKIATLVSDFYKRPNLEPKHMDVGNLVLTENQGVQLLGQIKHGSCRPRAILFKVLADTVGLQSKLVMGLPTEGDSDCIDSYEHMSVTVLLNSMELLVDLMRFPGQLIPRSRKAIFFTHISAAGESDSAENDSCDSPLEPNSPLYGFSEKVDPDSAEKDDGFLHQRRLEASINPAGPSLGNMLPSPSVGRKLSSSHSEPNVATTFWRRSRRRDISQARTASSSPEHPFIQAHGRSMLSGDRKSSRNHTEDMGTSRSGSALTSDARRFRRRSISMTPQIGDDIVRAVRSMNETLKHNRLLREQGADSSYSHSSDDKNSAPGQDKNVEEFGNGDISGGRPPFNSYPREQIPQKAISLPSSPHEYRSETPNERDISKFNISVEAVSVWNRILELPAFQNNPLLPFQEWNIDYKELTVGTRVGIGFFGEVFRGIWNGTNVAIKVFLEQDLTAENMEDFCNEISILCRLRHPNVILFLGACITPPHLSMVTEYMEMGSLYYLIHLSEHRKNMSWRKRLKMLKDICRGLMCIHRMKIVHRDLKSANCLVDKHWMVKICDFGLSKIMTSSPIPHSSPAGTPEWMAPELIRNEPFTEKCDIFSLGVIMWELCTLNRPWGGVPPQRVVYAVANQGARLEIPEGPLSRLIADCWKEPNERPNCEEILARLHDC